MGRYNAQHWHTLTHLQYSAAYCTMWVMTDLAGYILVQSQQRQNLQPDTETYHKLL